MRKVLLALLTLLLPMLPGQAQAATFEQKNLPLLVSEAEQIFVGTVRALQSRKLPNGAIVTDATFSDLQLVKGESAGADIVLLVLGGEVDGLRLEIPGLPQFRRDTRYLVFAKGNGKHLFPVVGGPAGLFQIAAGAAGASPVVQNWSGGPLGAGIAAEVREGAGLPPQDATQPPITLEQFIAAIRAQLGAP
jgi:hypothetical protein